jgi:hypothetical protein
MPRPCTRSSSRLAHCRVLCCVALTAALSGCIAPLPITARERYLIPEESLRAIHPGQSTREDILLMFADPDTRGDRDAYFIYQWVKASGGIGFVVAVPYPVAGGSNVAESCHNLVIEFGADGRVTRSRVFDGKALDKPDVSLGQRIRRTRSSGSIKCDPELARAVAAWLKETAP